MTHLSDEIKSALIDLEWEQSSANEFRRFVPEFKMGGAVSNGDRWVNLEISENGRWFSRLDGWGNVEIHVDLREFYEDAKGVELAIEAVLKN